MFGRLRAVDEVSLRFERGSIHAVVGENGAGKSTLMNLISGATAPSSGQIKLGSGSTIGMVHQHFMLVPRFTVLENLQLSAMSGLLRRAEKEAVRAQSEAVAAAIGWELPFERVAGELAVGVQQRIEVIRALVNNPDVVILDEPTAVLSQGEVEELFGVLRQLRDQGKCIILIAHKLAEVLSIAEEIAILRRGRLVATTSSGEASAEELAALMVGEVPEPDQIEQKLSGEAVLKVEDLRVYSDRQSEAVRSVSIELATGEILGIGGVDGNGQIELAEALAGIRPPASGTISRGAEAVVRYLPQDRQSEGLALDLSLADNIAAGHEAHQPRSNGVWFNPFKSTSLAQEAIGKFDIRAESATQPVASLSGGNQQKVVVARVLEQPPNVLVAVNPTRGLDIAAASFVMEQIRRAASTGTGVILFSTDRDELAALANRTFYMGSGRLFESESDALQGASA